MFLNIKFLLNHKQIYNLTFKYLFFKVREIKFMNIGNRFSVNLVIIILKLSNLNYKINKNIIYVILN